MEPLQTDIVRPLKVAVFGVLGVGKSTLLAAMQHTLLTITGSGPVCICPCGGHYERSTITDAGHGDSGHEIPRSLKDLLKNPLCHTSFPYMETVTTAASQSDEQPCTGQHILFIDLPGLGSIHDSTTLELWNDVMQFCDLVIYVHDLGMPQEARELKEILSWLTEGLSKKADVYEGPRLLVACTKMDIAGPQDGVKAMRSLLKEKLLDDEGNTFLINYLEARDDGLIPPSLADAEDETIFQTLFPINPAAALQARLFLQGTIDHGHLEQLVLRVMGRQQGMQLIGRGDRQEMMTAIGEEMAREEERVSGIRVFEEALQQWVCSYYRRRSEGILFLENLRAQGFEPIPSHIPVLSTESRAQQKTALRVAIGATAVALPILLASGFVLSPLIAIEGGLLATMAGMASATTVAGVWGNAGFVFSKRSQLKYTTPQATVAKDLVVHLRRAMGAKYIDRARDMSQRIDSKQQALPDGVFFDFEYFPDTNTPPAPPSNDLNSSNQKVRYAGGFRETSKEKFTYHGPGMLFYKDTQTTAISGTFVDGVLDGPAVVYDSNTGHKSLRVRFTRGVLCDFFPEDPSSLSDYMAWLQSQDVVAVDVAYENQRYYLFKAWGVPNLKGDPDSWTDIDGNLIPSLDEMELPGSDWTWTSNWQIATDTAGDNQALRTDPEGWRYSVNFVSDSAWWHPKMGPTDFVRRRKWIRKRRRLWENMEGSFMIS